MKLSVEMPALICKICVILRSDLPLLEVKNEQGWKLIPGLKGNL
jgi:hypothetical protein